MVDLPTVQNGNITSTAPQSAITPGIIEQGANMRAAAYGKVADDLMDVSTELAKKQAADDLMKQKIVRNADGSATVENPATAPLIFGEAGKAYADAVRIGTIAQHSNDLSQHFNELHQQYPADPAAFKVASDAFLEKRATQITGPIGEAIQREGGQLQTQHYNAITDRAASAELATQGSAISASRQSARDDVMTMMRGGAALEDPAVQAKIRQYDAATELRAANPLFGYSKIQAQLDRETFHSAASANRFVYNNDQIYKAQGYDAAMEAAKDILVNPAYKMSDPDREAFYHKATAGIRANEAIRRQDLGEARASFSDLQLSSATGQPIESDRVEQTAKAFRAAGDPGSAARVYAWAARKPLNDSFGQQPLAEQTKQLAALHGVNAAAAAYSFFVGKGYTQEQAAGIVGNLVHESGLDPAASGDNGTSGGLAQFHNERLKALQAFAAERGKPATDFQTQLEFVDHELHTTEGRTLAKLQAAKTPEDAAGAFIDYERPMGWTQENPAGGLGYESRKALARTVFSGKPTDTSMGPAGSGWLEANRQRTLDMAAQTQWSTIMDDYRKTGARPAPQLVNDIVNAGRASRNAGFLETIAADTARMGLARDASRSPLATQQDTIVRLDAAGQAGDLSPGHAALLTDLQKRNAAITKGLDENPIATTVENFPDKFKAPGPLDFSSPGALAGSLANRAAIAQFASLNWQTPQLSVLDQADVKQLQTALQGPQGATVLTTMASGLKQPEMLKLLEQKDVRDTITGMQSSADASKMTAANSIADALWRSDPARAELLLGPKAIDKLHAWQGLKDSFNSEEIAANLNAPRDPSVMKVREEARKAALEEADKLKPADIAYKLGSGSWLFGGNPPVGATAAYAPTGKQVDYRYLPDATAANVLRDDYKQTYAALRADGLDADKASELAVKRLQSTWGVSQAAGGMLMRYPPENSPAFPAIGGSKDWISDDLRAWVAKRAGPEFSEGPRSLEAGVALAGRERNWDIAGLIADSRTETEFSAGQKPSYIVAVRRSDGTLALLGAARGEPRVTFDPSSHVADYEARLRAKLANLTAVRANQFALSQALP
ncbi:hypothetical protein UP09_30985 [Bradyrhizobium sp. LTSP885]|uniref:phage tail tip lysozyme n=1 Tax=Bradyrhizobium sp. LTSP885 TaxID=1619232 RepID=UPI0005C8E1BE|nr:phage tail tip lysozyme [Bradyrhizobium sp. LTSP885]KJC35651.1 hypothetical protein UP09_30985 [Bradyrhizobium sp. LTSP885]